MFCLSVFAHMCGQKQQFLSLFQRCNTDELKVKCHLTLCISQLLNHKHTELSGFQQQVRVISLSARPRRLGHLKSSAANSIFG